MTDSQKRAENLDFDPLAWSSAMANAALTAQQMAQQFVTETTAEDTADPDPLGLVAAFGEVAASLMRDPASTWNAQLAMWQDSMSLWANTWQRLAGQDVESVIEPDPEDRRFRDDAWRDEVLFDFIKQSYLLASRCLLSSVRSARGLDEKTAAKADFYSRQYIDALAPTNFALTNPQVLRETQSSNGQNLVNGLNNMLEDLQRGKGDLQIRMTDSDAFELGVNVATTAGKVVYQNEMMQLIQYSPATDSVFRRPLLIMPPWINKYYILDLRPTNSFVKWLVEQGYTVFVISWVNPDESLANKNFDDYLQDGPLAALDAIEQATGESEVNVIGYCLGGTLLATLLAYLLARDDARVTSATFLTSMIDFADPGELGVFIDEAQVANLEKQMNAQGYLDGASMATTFNKLRANDLIWSFVINNYLLGKEPFAFDLLYWNSDSTRMPAKMHSYYLRNMYMENRLKEPGGLTVAETPIDVTRIKTPAYFLSTLEDHIAPWKSTFAGAKLLDGPVRFVLGASGHIAGVVNPPAANKYGYWTRARALPKDADTWFAGATQNDGSWWSDWAKWSKRHSQGQVPARVPGDGQLKVIEDAPGAYARVRADDNA